MRVLTLRTQTGLRGSLNALTSAKLPKAGDRLKVVGVTFFLPLCSNAGRFTSQIMRHFEKLKFTFRPHPADKFMYSAFKAAFL